MELKAGVKTFYPKNRKAWRAWLQKNGATEKSVWVIMYRKDSGKQSITYGEGVEEALCFGWIDSKANKRDEESFYQLFAQRKPASNWSMLNKKRVKELTAKGLMTPAGIAVIDRSKANGRWNALDSIENGEVPADVTKALNAQTGAAKNFNAFPPSARKGILQWIQSAKTPATREKRIAETASLAAKNIRANQYVRRETSDVRREK